MSVDEVPVGNVRVDIYHLGRTWLPGALAAVLDGVVEEKKLTRLQFHVETGSEGVTAYLVDHATSFDWWMFTAGCTLANHL